MSPANVFCISHMTVRFQLIFHDFWMMDAVDMIKGNQTILVMPMIQTNDGNE